MLSIKLSPISVIYQSNKTTRSTERSTVKIADVLIFKMEIHFLGTGSAYPAPKRCSSCTVLRHEKGAWVFDCGEGSQIQFQKSSLKPGTIKKIFITHLHGDHLFGLPGLLCTIGMNNSINGGHVDIYGPIGLKSFIRSSLALSYSHLPYTFSVHEIVLSSYNGKLFY